MDHMVSKKIVHSVVKKLQEGLDRQYFEFQVITKGREPFWRKVS
ncbi:hypothetical protein T472_0214610 [Youngiibacter fragilis 232.1]|uniref:Uncharacterized protein n=1 Tax=Youngiibacter fragilis 232.1 TaxID=994573 RepID=V7I447_9CLOT|nr:hypothetical protein T472_0214610 [Youngiibacter fragilis 232.1]